MRIDRFKEWKDVEAEWRMAEEEVHSPHHQHFHQQMINNPSLTGINASSKNIQQQQRPTGGLLMPAAHVHNRTSPHQHGVPASTAVPGANASSAAHHQSKPIELMSREELGASRASLLDAEAYLMEERRRLDMEQMRLRLEAERIAEEKRKLQVKITTPT
jgi:hypothetical protein